ncbi:transporter, dicarboxylate/amino acid:cation Na+/H+ symporter family protein [Anaeromyces robustus]|uniref:Amino acid transporter n=1 Tax=Anaeromyces robustus TaxID=1754192 RepID=A0A1Y1WY44_9FUNG|nr:transporter, dicarboxylate/amino acid:cation Na+/H+ symporter family protein [Anaeromyces robustus]|eukprot:ORX78372.1 transporter, dicarboxylate/amino acid:cation Na+/H+ symporter family protein [Anaeromyces robustus]
MNVKEIISIFHHVNLVIKIIIGLIIGAVLGVFFKDLPIIPLIGDMFVDVLKSVAPILVFTLVISSLTQGNSKLDKRFTLILVLYFISTFLSSLLTVIVDYIYPISVKLAEEYKAENVPTSMQEVIKNLFLNMVGNPVGALRDAEYICILFWAILIGIGAKTIASDTTKKLIEDISNIVLEIINWIIVASPYGILGLVYTSVSTNGISIFTDYGKLIIVLVLCMLITGLIINPIIVAIVLRRNPYPLIFICLKESGITAFFTRSSAANIPINLKLSEKLGLDKEIYSVSIPFGATVNMQGAAITIAVMALAAANTVKIEVSFISATVLLFVATLGACGSSGVANGCLFMIPMACSLLGCSDEVSMQIVGIGFIVAVVQDAFCTALNSSSDVVFTATAEYLKWKKEGKSLPTFLGGKTVVDISKKKSKKSKDNNENENENIVIKIESNTDLLKKVSNIEEKDELW